MAKSSDSKRDRKVPLVNLVRNARLGDGKSASDYRAKLVALAMATYANANGGNCFPKLETLADDCQMHKGKVSEAWTALKGMNVIKEVRRRRRVKVWKFDIEELQARQRQPRVSSPTGNLQDDVSSPTGKVKVPPPGRDKFPHREPDLSVDQPNEQWTSGHPPKNPRASNWRHPFRPNLSRKEWESVVKAWRPPTDFMITHLDRFRAWAITNMEHRTEAALLKAWEGWQRHERENPLQPLK